jgi:hypothetical protein
MITEEQKQENLKSFARERANVLLNIPAQCRDWVLFYMPSECFGALCAFHDGKAVRAKIEFYMNNPDKIHWELTEKQTKELFKESFK